MNDSLSHPSPPLAIAARQLSTLLGFVMIVPQFNLYYTVTPVSFFLSLLQGGSVPRAIYLPTPLPVQYCTLYNVQCTLYTVQIKPVLEKYVQHGLISLEEGVPLKSKPIYMII